MASSADSPFLNLPAELRNNIYELVLEEDASQELCLCQNRGARDNVPLHWSDCSVREHYKRPPLLSVCHQVMVEAGSIWYAQVQLRTVFVNDIKDFISTIGQENAMRLSSVIMEAVPNLDSAMKRAAMREDEWTGNGIALREGVLKMSFRYRGLDVIASNPEEEADRIDEEDEED